MGGPAAQGPSGLGHAGLVGRGAPAAVAAATEGGAYSFFFFFFAEEDAASTAAGQIAHSPSVSPALLAPDLLLEAGLGLCGDLLTRGLCCFGCGLGLCGGSLRHGLCTGGPASAPAVLTAGRSSLLCHPSSAVRCSDICAEAAPAAPVLLCGSLSGFPALGCGLLMLSFSTSACSCSASLLLACSCSGGAAFLPVSCAGAAWGPLGRGTEGGALCSVLLDALGASLGNSMGSRAASGLAAAVAAGCANKKRLFDMPEASARQNSPQISLARTLHYVSGKTCSIKLHPKHMMDS